VAFHAGFDRVLITRHLRALCGRRLANPWLDLADLAPALCPRVKAHALDDWLAHFSIDVAVRHQAAADTWATAELLQRLWPLARAQGSRTDFSALARLAASRRWIAS
jgi:DNA polymerase III subunit epsilon